MADTFVFSLVGLDSLKSRLQMMERTAKGSRRLMTAIYGKAYFNIMQNFRRKGSTADILSEGIPNDNFKTWVGLGPLQQANREFRGTDASGPLQDSGRLRMSIGTVRKITDTEMEIGTDLFSAPTMHFGAVIKPKNAKFLTLPMPGITGSARSYENTFFKGGMMFQNLPGGGIRPLFVLRKQVKIPARPFMTVSDTTLSEISGLVADAITKF